jgi:hypothetical protein
MFCPASPFIALWGISALMIGRASGTMSFVSNYENEEIYRKNVATASSSHNAVAAALFNL